MIVACVRTGIKYPVEYVYKLRDMVARHLKAEHRFVCLTDYPTALPDIECIKVDNGLPGWWAKMQLFSTQWRQGEKVVYFDLDMVICNNIDSLAELEVDFAVCGSFTRAAGNKNWPCIYGSCCMVLGSQLDVYIWEIFCRNKVALMAAAGNYGDQMALQHIRPDATILQDVLPKGFFLGYRNLTHHKPAECSVVVFAGANKPHNCNEQWIAKEWARS